MKKVICLFSCVVLLLTGCMKPLYSPTAHNVPLHTEKGELKANASAGTSWTPANIFATYSNHFNFQTSYSISNKFALAMNYTTSWGTAQDFFFNSFTQSWRTKDLEGSLGLFKIIDKKFVLEGYAGFGYGSCKVKFPERNSSYIYNPTKILLQVNSAYVVRNFEIALSVKCVRQMMGMVKDSSNIDIFVYREINTLNSIPAQSYIEPALTIRVGAERIKMSMQAIYVAGISGDRYYYDRLFLNAGLHFLLYRNPKPGPQFLK